MNTLETDFGDRRITLTAQSFDDSKFSLFGIEWSWTNPFTEDFWLDITLFNYSLLLDILKFPDPTDNFKPPKFLGFT